MVQSTFFLSMLLMKRRSESTSDPEGVTCISEWPTVEACLWETGINCNRLVWWQHTNTVPPLSANSWRLGGWWIPL